MVIEQVFKEDKGVTFKFRSPHVGHAFYLTVTATILKDECTPNQVFINSKSNPEFQYVTALNVFISKLITSRVMSLKEVSEELLSIHDPSKGGYFVGGRRVNGIISHVGLLLGRCADKKILESLYEDCKT